ncbi:MAG: hypothetical protein LBH49_02380 [Puniceicoccales bacterium]|jgi:hypothetical protein|nr:hypothetical protein [Puniceicoccales bacterium]
MDGWFTSLGNYLQGLDPEIVNATIKAIIFLLALAAGGVLLVRLCKSQRYCDHSRLHYDNEDRIYIVDRKAIGLKSAFTVVKYGHRKFLVCIHKDKVTYIGDVSNYGHRPFRDKKLHAKPPRSTEKI